MRAQIVKNTLRAIGVVTLLCAFPSHAVTVEVLSDRGFESTVGQGTQLTWGPGDIGSWAVGNSFSIVGDTGGITTLDGTKMMALDTTSAAGDLSVDVYQVVDVTGFSSVIDAGIVTADLTVFYNSTAATNGGLSLYSWDSQPSEFNGQKLGGGASNSLAIDGDVGTWEEFNLSILLPVGVRYLAFGMHEVTDAPIGYADSTSMTLSYAVVPLPAAVWLFGAGLLGLLGVARKNRSQVQGQAV